MAHNFTLKVSVELNRVSGKFASRDEMLEALIGMVEGADEGQVDGIGADGESNYTIDMWEVEEL